MTSTVDNICVNIKIRFDSLLKMYAMYQKHTSDTAINDAIRDLQAIQKIYNSETMEVLSKFYNATNDDERKQQHMAFVKIFHAINIIGGISRLFTLAQTVKKKYRIEDQELTELIKTYMSTSVDETFVSQKADYCPVCNLQYFIEEKTAEYICKRCGKTEKLSGVVFEDDQFYYQEGQRTKHGRYDPIKHARCWLDRIQAREMTEIPFDVLNAVKACIQRDKLWVANVSCDTIRKYLKELKRTSYNDHVPLIRKLTTGIEPDQLTEHEMQLVFMHFGVVLQIYTALYDDPNCPYHPFFLYKIIEQVLKKPKDDKRRRSILSCIHLQARNTLVENDRSWFSICDYIPEFTKIPTARIK